MSPASLLLRDVSQNLGQTRLPSRSAENGTPCAPTVLPNQMMMVFAPGHPFRLLLGRENLVLQGFPSADPSLSELIEGTPETAMTDLAGNMVSTPVMLAIAMAAISSVSWRPMPRPSHLSSSIAGADALALLRSIVPSPPCDPACDAEAAGSKRQRP